MGKQRRQRQKLHLPASNKQNSPQTEKNVMDTSDPLIFKPTENLFAGINIDFNSLNKKLSDDTRSVRSFKSVKSQLGEDKVLPKKEKLKLRKELLLRKIDTVTQLKKESKKRQKRKTTSLIGDTNPLHDALPSLESLLKSRPTTSKAQQVQKPKGIQRASKRKKNLVEGVKCFKQLMSNKMIQKNPLQAVTEHVKALVEREKQVKGK